MTRAEVCECGHVRGVHTDEKCRACPCNNVTVAQDAQAAILAGIDRKKAQIEAANQRRRAARGLGGLRRG